jgi:hypothetical protein
MMCRCPFQPEAARIEVRFIYLFVGSFAATCSSRCFALWPMFMLRSLLPADGNQGFRPREFMDNRDQIELYHA